MHFCYVDESGDCGRFDPQNPTQTGSPYFILAGMLVDSSKWKVSLETLKAFRKKLATDAFFPYDVEFHCAEMIDPHKTKVFSSISVSDRWKLIEAYAETLGNCRALSIIAVVIDKKSSSLHPSEYLTTAITLL